MKKAHSCLLAYRSYSGPIFFARGVHFDNSRWLLPDSPTEKLKDYVEDSFGQEEEFIVAVSLKQDFFFKKCFSFPYRL